jgi:UDP-N-acetylglucosamine 2-epimerase (non-hydrolysing)
MDRSDRLSVLVLFGTRPELIKLAPVIERLSADERFRVAVASTSQHRELLVEPLELFGIRPDFDLDVIRPEQTLGEITARTIVGLDPILSRHRPQLMLVQGDTTSAMSGALTAFSHRVPVGHVEAGLRSFDRAHPYPEEINRRLLSVLAELHFAPTEAGERNLLAEGVEPERIYVTGNTGIDALHRMLDRRGDALAPWLADTPLEGRRLVLVTAHRRESFDGHLGELCRGLLELAQAHPDLLFLYPVHPNPNVQRTVLPLLAGHPRMRLTDPLPYDAFVDAMARSHLIITDSGGVQEEAPELGKPLVVFRKVTERGEGVARAGARVAGLSRETLVAEVSRLVSDADAYRRASSGPRNLYGDGQAARRVVEAILHRFGRGPRPEPFRSAAGAAQR